LVIILSPQNLPLILLPRGKIGWEVGGNRNASGNENEKEKENENENASGNRKRNGNGNGNENGNENGNGNRNRNADVDGDKDGYYRSVILFNSSLWCTYVSSVYRYKVVRLYL
jgi:hypothetical protein